MAGIWIGIFLGIFIAGLCQMAGERRRWDELD